MRRIIFIILFATSFNSTFSQTRDTLKNRLSFSTNVIQIPINELGLSVDYCFNKKHSFGLNAGYIYANPAFKVFYFSPNQDTYPGTVWEGIVTRFNYKYYTSGKQEYIAGQITYKSLSYRNQSFRNLQGDNVNSFTRSEDTYLIGVDILMGQHLKSSMTSKTNIELFYGFGIRYRGRNYTTSSSHYSYYSNAVAIGAFHKTQAYPMVTFGLKIGLNTFW